MLFFEILPKSSTDAKSKFSLSAKSTTTSTIFEEDYPIVLTQCLNAEKGYDIKTPFDIQDLKTTIAEINDTEVLCKKNPQISKIIFFNFFTKLCKKANNYS